MFYSVYQRKKLTRSRIPQHRLESPGGKAFTWLQLTFDPSGRQENTNITNIIFLSIHFHLKTTSIVCTLERTSKLGHQEQCLPENLIEPFETIIT